MPTVQELFDLSGRVAVLPGGAGSLGSQMAAALAEAGAHVVIANRRLEVAQAKAAELSHFRDDGGASGCAGLCFGRRDDRRCRDQVRPY